MIVIRDSSGAYFSEFKKVGINGFGMPTFVLPMICEPMQIVVFGSMDDAKSTLRIIKAQIEERNLLGRRHGEVEAVDLGQRIETLENQVKMYEAMRPQWMMGYTSDSIAAQTSSAALSQLWNMLGADNQTTAVGRLKKLKGEL